MMERIKAIGGFLLIMGVGYFAGMLWTVPTMALQDVSVPYTFGDTDTIYASRFNANYDTLEVYFNKLNDSLDLRFIRYSNLNNGDSTLSRLQVDTVRSNPDIDSIRGNPYIDTVRTSHITAPVISGNTTMSNNLTVTGNTTTNGNLFINDSTSISISSNVYKNYRPVFMPIRFTVSPDSNVTSVTDYHGIDLLMVTDDEHVDKNVRLYPFESTARFDGNDSIAALFAGYFQANNAENGWVSEACALRLWIQNDGNGHINNSKLLKLTNPDNATGTMDTVFGIYMEGMTRGDSVNYGIYNLSENNFFLGLDIGSSANRSAHIGRSIIGYNGVDGDVATFAHEDNNNDTAYALYQTAAGITYVNAKQGYRLGLCIDDIPIARVTSTGLSIGSSDPTQKLNVEGHATIDSTLTVEGDIYGVGVYATRIGVGQSTVIDSIYKNAGQDTLIFRTSGGQEYAIPAR